MSGLLFVGVVKKGEEDSLIESMNKATRDWTDRAARGECGWVCADCCGSCSTGMPDECMYGDQRCTAIIQRDKRAAGIGIDEA